MSLAEIVGVWKRVGCEIWSCLEEINALIRVVNVSASFVGKNEDLRPNERH